LIAFGSGGIKPCVAAFGGEQFKLPQQAKQLGIFFSIFYFAINLGSFISTSVTPILREDIHCFGQNDCFPLGFGLPAALMAVSILIFLGGKFLYKIVPPQGNMFVKVCKCIGVSWRSLKRIFEHINRRFRPPSVQKVARSTQILRIIGWIMLSQLMARSL
jgi:solute carrier family 15 oligopeptide transporter 1